jgi:hypothetical protein
MAQVLDKNTCKLVAAEYDVVVVDKEEEGAAGSQVGAGLGWGCGGMGCSSCGS